jgi:hypothetical protein
LKERLDGDRDGGGIGFQKSILKFFCKIWQLLEPPWGGFKPSPPLYSDWDMGTAKNRFEL